MNSSDMNINGELLEKIKTLPDNPGIYKYLDKSGKVIYVGKAKNIKKRVNSYFVKNHSTFKLHLLVKKIANVEYIVVDTESDALLLENVLIKKLQPKYNVMLKDDKTYPWLCIKNERFPRVFYTRRKINDGSEYFGPFTSLYMIKTLLNLVRQLYPIRTCNLVLSETNIDLGKFKLCLEYHIGNCLAPCEGKVSEDNYLSFIRDIREIMRGDLHIVQNYLKQKMNEFANDLMFEQAAKLKDKIDIIENYKSKSTIVDTNISNVEVYGFAKDIGSGYINFLRVQNGAIIAAHSIEIRKRIEETDNDMLLHGIIEMRQIMQSDIKSVLVPFVPEFSPEGIKFEVPKRGDRVKVLELAMRNAKFFMLEKHKQIENKNPERHAIRKMETLQKDLRMNALPSHIECFDNSNIQGANPVAACVVFKNSKPSKADYRHYNIKTVEGPDDFASMYEVVLRRYSRLLKENQEIPQLVVIDGGKGQLGSAVKALRELGIVEKVCIVGIAKKLEEIYFADDSIPLYLDKNSESLKLIQQLRDEAHRFGISFHRNQRSKTFITSELNSIDGIGEKTMLSLLGHFKSIKKIKDAQLEDLIMIVGKSKASIIFDYFHKKKG
jgi:excinuclease ABC subunit C